MQPNWVSIFLGSTFCFRLDNLLTWYLPASSHLLCLIFSGTPSALDRVVVRFSQEAKHLNPVQETCAYGSHPDGVPKMGSEVCHQVDQLPLESVVRQQGKVVVYMGGAEGFSR